MDNPKLNADFVSLNFYVIVVFFLVPDSLLPKQ